MPLLDTLLGLFGLRRGKGAPPSSKASSALSSIDAQLSETQTIQAQLLKEFSLQQQAIKDGIREDMAGRADDSQYWWNCPDAPEPFIPQFDAINNDSVLESLSQRLQSGTFSMIEIPENILRAVRVMNNPEFDYGEVVQLISRSPMMAGEFLRIVNSALYRRGAEITNLAVALPRLGRENVKAILYLYSSRNTLSGVPAFNDVAHDIVEHCYAVGAIARYLSQRYFPDPDLAFMAGLLHDIGKVAILKELSDNYEIPHIYFQLHEESFSCVFPPLHAEVGRRCAEYWRLPEAIVETIARHHDYIDYPFGDESDVAYMLSALVSFSDTMAKILGKGMYISGVDIFEHPACSVLNIERSHSVIDFFKPIDKLIKKQDVEPKEAADGSASDNTPGGASRHAKAKPKKR